MVYEMNRRAFLLALAPSLSCTPGGGGGGGRRSGIHVFVANEEKPAQWRGGFDDLPGDEGIRIDGAPRLSCRTRARPSVYVLTPGTGTVRDRFRLLFRSGGKLACAVGPFDASAADGQVALDSEPRGEGFDPAGSRSIPPKRGARLKLPARRDFEPVGPDTRDQFPATGDRPSPDWAPARWSA